MAEVIVLSVGIRLYASFSLKDKRKIKRKLVTRLENTYNISIKETADQDLLNYLSLTVSHVALDRRAGDRFLSRFESAVEALILGEGELARYDVDMINYR